VFTKFSCFTLRRLTNTFHIVTSNFWGRDLISIYVKVLQTAYFLASTLPKLYIYTYTHTNTHTNLSPLPWFNKVHLRSLFRLEQKSEFYTPKISTKIQKIGKIKNINKQPHFREEVAHSKYLSCYISYE
jgi:hypothetical protein